MYKIVLLSLVLIATACSDGDHYRINIDEVTPVSIARYDSLIFRYVHASDSTTAMALKSEGGVFWNIYNRHILNLVDAPYFREGLNNFYHTYASIGLFDKCFTTYAHAEQEAYLLAQMAARYKKLFPLNPLPSFQFHLSGLRSQSIVTVDSLVSISVDCYLDNCDLYKSRYYDYELQLHNRSRILPDVSEVLLRNALPATNNTTLLDAMVYEGRIAYLMSGLIDNRTSMAVMGYTEQQNEWCKENEELIWTTIVERGDLFSCDNITINKYMRPAPFTAAIAQNSPGRLGRWIGWRIVDAYARKQGLTPQQIASDTRAATEVLRLSGYNGK